MKVVELIQLLQSFDPEMTLDGCAGLGGVSVSPDITNILDPQASRPAAAPVAAEKAPRRARQVKQYKKPHSGEVIETKSGNHRKLKEWKAEYGSDEVESWISK